jgi:hypothetical protein
MIATSFSNQLAEVTKRPLWYRFPTRFPIGFLIDSLIDLNNVLALTRSPVRPTLLLWWPTVLHLRPLSLLLLLLAGLLLHPSLLLLLGSHLWLLRLLLLLLTGLLLQPSLLLLLVGHLRLLSLWLLGLWLLLRDNGLQWWRSYISTCHRATKHDFVELGECFADTVDFSDYAVACAEPPSAFAGEQFFQLRL